MSGYQAGAHQALGRQVQEASGARAGIGDGGVPVDHQGQVRAVLYQRAEVLLPAGQLGGALLDLRVELPGKGEVLHHRHELAEDDQPDLEEDQHPEEGVDAHAASQVVARQDACQQHRRVREHDRPSGPHPGLGRGVTAAIGDQRAEHDQQIPDKPAGVDEVTLAVDAGLGQVGEQAVGERDPGEPGADQEQRRPRRRARSSQQEDHQRDGDDVADRIGQREDLLEHRVARRPEQRPQHRLPAQRQHRRGDAEAVQHPPGLGHAALRTGGVAEQRGGRQRDGEQIAKVRQRGERHRSTGHHLVVGPHHLAKGPAGRRSAQQIPRPSKATRAAPSQPGAGEGGGNRRQRLGQVVHQREGHPRTAKPGREPGHEPRRGRHHTGHGQRERPPGDHLGVANALPHARLVLSTRIDLPVPSDARRSS